MDFVQEHLVNIVIMIVFYIAGEIRNPTVKKMTRKKKVKGFNVLKTSVHKKTLAGKK